ncbi:unnamed protein product [Vitrella brassicaformis CCMP3155]|uniref:TLDc domain-containing protein n=1 Tax=Vitrella brassicaformis (strain CCMP3155) TaxID=1169540 RepID=A0A0G4GTI2_VITBC|nr:unnamed protein product [Vitrella brassicaformis CCMP3155]|eukprot:CEM34054.1 unnamed protein product [Vitrella brassicaformis CCMP3155]
MSAIRTSAAEDQTALSAPLSMTEAIPGCMSSPLSPRVMTLEEAADQLIHAERKARKQCAAVFSCGLILGIALGLLMAALINGSLRTVEPPAAREMASESDQNDTHAVIGSPIGPANRCPALSETGDWEGERQMQPHQDGTDEQMGYHDLPEAAAGETPRHSADAKGDGEEHADGATSVASLGCSMQFVVVVSLAAVAALSAYQTLQLGALRTEINAIHTMPVTFPDMSLTVLQYASLHGWLGAKKPLGVVYRSSGDGTTYSDLLRCVGDKTGLVIIVRRGRYVFGVYISAGLQPPDDPTSYRRCNCDVWWFSLVGHFDKPTKIKIDRGQWVFVAGREGSASGASVYISGNLYLGDGGVWPAADIRSCYQYTNNKNVPAGYMGDRDKFGEALLGGSKKFMADEIEVLQVVGSE